MTNPHPWSGSLEMCLLAIACAEAHPQYYPRSAVEAQADQPPTANDLRLLSGDSNREEAEDASKTPSAEAATGVPEQTPGEATQIQALIRELAKMQDPSPGLSPTMSGEGFAPVPWARRMMSGILMNHGLKNTEAFTLLVQHGPAALPYLLASLDDKTPTKLVIEHGGCFGMMSYGQRAAIRWVASEADLIHHLAEENAADEKIAESVDAAPAFIAMAKSGELPWFLPQSCREFNPGNAAEKRVLDAARQTLVEMKGQPSDFDAFDPGLREYAVTIGDACYVIVGQITNRTYLAAQYQPSACVYIHSPTHDPKIAADVREVWSSEKPAEMLLASLKTDFASGHRHRGYREGAVLRLGYYFPEESEALLLELLAKIESPSKADDDAQHNYPYENVELLEAIVASRSPAVRARAFEIMKTTKNVHYFLSLTQAYGEEHDSLVLQRALEFTESLPESDAYSAEPVLGMIAKRFPADAKKVFLTFVESESLQRRDAVINALWYNPLALELLPPLLDDKRDLGHYTSRGRVCDRAAQAISNNEQAITFSNAAPEQYRDGQIQKIKLHCIGIGVRKTGTDH